MTPLFPGWHLPTLRRKPKSSLQKRLDDQKAIDRLKLNSLSQTLAKYLPASLFKTDQSKNFSRRRIFSLENTFWGFFYQVLNPDKSCQAVVNQIRLRFNQESNQSKISQSTSVYCQARKKLPTEALDQIFHHTASNNAKRDKCFLQGRRTVVVDGTGVSMPDTTENQLDFPQPRSQKPGCGFPQARICACFDLYSGLALSYEVGNKKSHELPLLRKQMNTFQAGDVFLGDKGFISYADILAFQNKGVDSVIGLAKRKPVSASDADKILGDGDLLIHWKRTPKNRTISNQEEWLALPDVLPLRQISVSVNIPGYRPKDFYVVTTLLDPIQYPAEQIRQLYLKRWEVEVNFRDLKTTLGMDILSCKTPNMIEKEILIHFIAYNVLKRLMQDSSQLTRSSNTQLSFNACRQILLGHANDLSRTPIKFVDLLKLMSQNILIKRPNRVEPRVVKRRPKPFKLMVKTRSELKAELLDESHAKLA